MKKQFTEKSTFFISKQWLIIGLLVTTSLVSCKKNKVPKVETKSYVTISNSSVELFGNVSDDGGSLIVERGFCWGQMEMPTLENSNVSAVSGEMGQFSKVIEALAYNSFYYFRAFARNKYGIAYGEPILITTQGFPFTTPSCNPQTNWAYFNNVNMNYYTTINTTSVGYAWTLQGNATYSDLGIHFSQEPKTGNYITVNYTSDINNSQCEVSGVFGIGLGYFYMAEAGDTVHVLNDGNGHFSMSFCGLTFHSGSTTYVFTTNGNLSN